MVFASAAVLAESAFTVSVFLSVSFDAKVVCALTTLKQDTNRPIASNDLVSFVNILSMFG
jgi:hypothetical protein